jgi:hypothetical protein
MLGAFLSLLGAQLMYATVEINAHKLGRFLGSAIQKSRSNLAAGHPPEARPSLGQEGMK